MDKETILKEVAHKVEEEMWKRHFWLSFISGILEKKYLYVCKRTFKKLMP